MPSFSSVIKGGVLFLFLFVCVSVIKRLNILTGSGRMTIIEEIIEDTSPKRCEFLSEDEGPLPVILMSLGRSGSSVTWDTLSRMTGHAATVAYEVTGQTRFKSSDFFERIDPRIGAKWASNRLCEIQKRHPRDAGIIGFQWKPYRITFKSIYAIGALEEMGTHQNPPIRIIYLKRNPLDRRISNLRHKDQDMYLPAHCSIGDVECVKGHTQKSQNVTIPSGAELIKWLRTYKVTDRLVRDQLLMSGVRHISIDYNKLYLSNNADEWTRVFSFLGRGPGMNLTMDDVRAHFSMAPTSPKNRTEIISNYDEVEETLVNTEFQYLLYN